MNKKKNREKIIMLVIGLLIMLAFIVPIGICIYPNFAPLRVKGIWTPYSYVVYEDYVWLVGYKGEETVVNIPERLFGRDVRRVGGYTGDYDDVPYRFCNEKRNVQKVIFPDTVEEIGAEAFYHCDTLTEVVLPSQLKKIGKNAFKGTSLKEIRLPNGLEVIGKEAFADNKEVDSLIIPETVIEIEEYAFADCSSLEEVVLPDTVYVKRGSFSDTPWQESMVEDFVVIGSGTLVKYNGNDKSVYIPEKVKCIANYIFEEENQPETIIIPESVEYICKNALSEKNLKYVILQGNDTELEDEFIDLRSSADHLITIVSAEGSTGQRYVEEHPDEMLTWMSLEEYETLQNE